MNKFNFQLECGWCGFCCRFDIIFNMQKNPYREPLVPKKHPFAGDQSGYCKVCVGILLVLWESAYAMFII